MPPKKRKAPKGMAKPLPPGQIITDLRKNQWKIGPLIGQGGFGYLYLGSDKTGSDVTTDASFVIKIEPHSNGPLFVELAFYQRAAKAEMISSWMKSQKQTHLGVPRYIGSGSFENDGTKYRFMIMDRFGQDVEKILLASSKIFPLRTVFSLSLRIVEALEYIHEQEYVHADIKASNLLTGFGNKNSSSVYLVDYGLAYRYCPSGKHVPYKEDPKRKHDGTIEYTSRDAHRGLAPCRRGDLEVLAYCMLQWICGKLPWENNLNNKDYVAQEKVKFMRDIGGSLRKCLGSTDLPSELEAYFKYVEKLEYEEKPDYDKIRKWFKDALKKTGHNDDGKSVYFDAVSPKKKTKETVPKKVVRKRKVVKIEESSDEAEEVSPPRRLRLSSSKSPKRSTAKVTTPLKNGQVEKKQVKRRSSSGDSPRKRSKQTKKESPKKKTTKKVKSPTTTPAAKAKKASYKTPPISSTDGSRRRVQRKKNISTRDFGQSP